MPLTITRSLAAGVLAAALSASLTATTSADENDDEEIPFAEAVVFINLNDTDGDLGLAAKIDGMGWRRLKVEGPNERQVLDIRVKRRLARQGLTELQIESAEPNFEELSPEAFFRRFPAGEYEVEGRTIDGLELESETELTHLLPATPDDISVSGVPAVEDCETQQPPQVADPVIIRWDPVTQSHPEIGESGPVEIIGYEVVVEREDPTLLVFSSQLPPTATALTIPAEFTALGEELKLEILATEASGNRTAIETCFDIAG